MYIAVIKGYTEVFECLLEIDDSAHCGECNNNALHAAVRNDNADIVTKIMEKRPELAKEQNGLDISPVRLSVQNGKVEMLRELLLHDYHLGYELNPQGLPLLSSAAARGNTAIATELLKHCHDAPYYQQSTGLTCLHEAVTSERTEFVKFVVEMPELRHLINLRDNKGKTALHYAVALCRANIVSVLLSHPDIDTTMVDNAGALAAWELRYAFTSAKTLEWNEVCMLLLKADPRDVGSIYHLQDQAKIVAMNESRKDAKTLIQTYTTNTSLIAILLATITFACAFTVPGGYSTEKGTEGQPILAGKLSFKTFLVSDTLAMCSSILIAFICIIVRWGDYEFLIYYRSITRYLMWFAYVASVITFVSGLFTVLSARLPWLAILICCLGALLLVFTKLLGEWPVLSLRCRLGRKTFKSQLLDMV